MTQYIDEVSRHKLDNEELDFLRSYEAGEWESVANVKQIKEQFQAYAAEMVNSSVQLSVDITERDVRTLRAKALEEGMAAESLVAMVIHKYVTGRLVEKV